MTITDIQNKFYFFTGTNSNQVTATNFLLLVNNAYEKAVRKILMADGRWQWDDTNQTDLPIALGSLVASQNDYSLATAHIAIEQVQILDQTGIWRMLIPLDKSDLKPFPPNEYFKNSGIPEYYDKQGSSIFLYPASNWSAASSLKIHFKRGPALFTSTEVTAGTKVPGFNSLYHNILALYAAFEYATAKNLPNKNHIFSLITSDEADMSADYGMRDKDEKPTMTTRKINAR